VVAVHLRDRAVPSPRRHAEGIARSLHDEHGHVHRVELVEPAPLGAARRVNRKREAEHGCRAGRLGGAAGDAGAGRAAAGDESQTRELVAAQMLEHCRPGGVELRRRRRRASPCDAIGLLDERHGEAERERGVSRRDEVRRVHASTRAVSEHERRAR
jgi:hypothetical protein